MKGKTLHCSATHKHVVKDETYGDHNYICTLYDMKFGFGQNL